MYQINNNKYAMAVKALLVSQLNSVPSEVA